MSGAAIFPVPETNHYSDYGFDPQTQIDYFQVLEEARRHSRRAADPPRPIDSLRFKLQKPISKDDARHSKKKRRSHWWKSASSALLFWKRPKSYTAAAAGDVGRRPYHLRPVSGPIYSTESTAAAAWAASGAPCRTTRPGCSGPLTAAEFGAAAGVSYMSLRDFNLVDGGRWFPTAAPPPAPVYLVT